MKPESNINEVLDETLINPEEIVVRLSFSDRPSTDELLTSLLESTLTKLVEVRNDLRARSMETVDDIRDVDGWSRTFFADIDQSITYGDLVGLVEHMKNGLAARRVAAAQ